MKIMLEIETSDDRSVEELLASLVDSMLYTFEPAGDHDIGIQQGRVVTLYVPPSTLG